MHIFIERLDSLRVEKGLSYAEISRQTGLSQTVFSKWVAGKSLPNIDSIAILCRYFNVPAGYLIGTED